MKFPDTYEESRDLFYQSAKTLETIWSRVEFMHIPLPGEPALSIDYFTGKPLASENMIVISSGLHGIEGYAGSAFIQFFIDQFLPGLNPQTTGITLIHAINPWGMKYERKVNERNVDLNRNFVWDWSAEASLANPDYESLKHFFQPKRWGMIPFTAGFVRALAKKGTKGVERALTLGQYGESKGLFYGGKGYQFSTRQMIDLYQKLFSSYRRILFLDLHTGYGPEDRMYLVNSSYEKEPADKWREKLGYPHIVQTTAEQFYEINGDMINYLYLLQKHRYPSVQLYATAMEFGTLGNSTPAQIRSLKTTISENYVYHHQRMDLERRAKKELRALYNPYDEKWRQKALEDAGAALRGILTWFCPLAY